MKNDFLFGRKKMFLYKMRNWGIIFILEEGGILFGIEVLIFFFSFMVLKCGRLLKEGGKNLEYEIR